MESVSTMNGAIFSRESKFFRAQTNAPVSPLCDEKFWPAAVFFRPKQYKRCQCSFPSLPFWTWLSVTQMALMLKSSPTMNGFCSSVVNFGAANASEFNKLRLILSNASTAHAGISKNVCVFS